MSHLIVFRKSYDLYKHFYEDLKTISKRDRFAWGERAETIALELLTLSMSAEYMARSEKLSTVRILSARIDLLKILIRLGNELRILDHKKYLARSGELLEIGKMTGGWLKSIQ